MATEYPKRDRFFAHRFCRLMGKVCIGAEIGPDACWLLALIAHTEDAAGYRRPVTFFNDDLASRTGMSVSSMIRARTRAVKAGWLNHTKGAKGRASFYFVMVPDWARGVTDSAGDESPDEWGEILCQIEAQNGHRTVTERPPSGGQAVTDRPQSDKHSSQDNLPQNNQDKSAAEPPPTLPFDPMREDEKNRKEFEAAWNQSGLRKLPRLTHSLHGRLRDLLLIPEWAATWRQALFRAGLNPFFAKGEGRRQGVLDPADFLRDDDFTRKVLDGYFDPRPAVRRSGGSVRSPARVECKPGEYGNKRDFVASEEAAAPQGAAGEVPARKAS